MSAKSIGALLQRVLQAGAVCGLASVATADLIAIDDDVAVDNATGLLWFRDLSRFSQMTRAQQTVSITSLTSEIGGQWRLAESAEVQALMNPTSNFDIDIIFAGGQFSVESIMTPTNFTVSFNGSTFDYDIDWAGRVADEGVGGQQALDAVNLNSLALPELTFTSDGTVNDSDTGSFGAWVVSEPGSGTATCFGDGSGHACPCTNGSPGAGCASSATTGAILLGTGDARFGSDTFGLAVTGIPGAKAGLCVKGSSLLGGGYGNPVGDGLLCAAPQKRSQVLVSDSGGNLTMNSWRGQPFGTFPGAANAGAATYYQWWYRDPQSSCSGSGFNFSNALVVAWQ